jgi:hypothetical protein
MNSTNTIRGTIWGLVTAAVLLGGAATAGPASAAGFTGPCSPGIGKHAATTTLTNRPDSGGAGNIWAVDGPNSRANPTGKMTRTLVITQVSHTGPLWVWTANICDGGTFAAQVGELAPNQGPGHAGEIITHAVTGTINGGAAYSFTTDQPLNTSPNLGVATSEDGAPLPGSGETTSLWFEQAFPAGTTFTGGITTWSWTYVGGVLGPQWRDGSDNGDGQVPAAGQIS